jgi:hypothetical protein
MKEFWIVKKTDDALLGLYKGQKTQTVIAGPFPTSTEAVTAMTLLHSRYCSDGSWLAIISSDEKPKDKKEFFEFIDHQLEDTVRLNGASDLTWDSIAAIRRK